MKTLSLQVILPADLPSLLHLSRREMEREVQHWVDYTDDELDAELNEAEDLGRRLREKVD